MKKCYLLLVLLFILATQLMAQLTGTKTIPGDYATVAAAVTDLNAQGVGAAGVTFNVAAGHTETTDIAEITATGTLANPIVFQKSGTGANPLLTRLTPGTIASTATLGSHGDGIIVINGGDYITFDGIDVRTDATFSGVGYMEYGYYLKKASGTDACKNVIIKNCAITLNKLAIYSFGVFVSNISGTTTVTVTSTGGRSENIKIFGNTISNCYGGVQLRGFNSAAPYDLYDQGNEIGDSGGNTISNYGGGASTAYAVYAIYQNNAKVNNNTITGGDGTTTTQYAIFFSTCINANIDINYNNISISNAATTSQLSGISIQAGATTGTTNTQNVIGNSLINFTRTAATTGVTYFIYFTSNQPLNLNVANNNINNHTLPGTGAVYGIYQISNPVNTIIADNNINTITRSGTTSTSAFYGINCDNATATNLTNVFGNVIHTLTGNGSTGAVGGITMGTQATYNTYKNKIYNITSDNAGGVVYGITVASGITNANVYNNLIGLLNAPNTSAATDAIRGINITSTTTNSNINVSHNTVYLNAVSAGANFSTTCIYHTTNATATTAVLNLRNNILVNTSTPAGTGVASAYRRSSTTLTNFGSLSNNNLFYAGPPSAGRLIFFDGTNSDQTIADYKSRVTPRETASITENPNLLSTTGSAANFLHINTAIPTQIESGGIPIAGVTDDYDGDTRNPTTPDIGADEFAGTLADLSAPTITYTPLVNTCTLAGVTLTASITDPSGVPTAGIGLPVLYWKKNAGAYSVVTAVSLGAGQYQFSFGAGVVAGDAVSYYIVAQDNAGTPNIGSFPSAGAAGFTANPPAASTPPTTPSSFTIQSNLSGTYTVGVAGVYPTITAAVAAYNSSCLSGPVVFSLLDATYPAETYPIIINPNSFASATNTLTIKPATGVSPVISGNLASGYLFRIYSNYVMMDGSNAVNGTTRDMTITNTSATAPSAVLYASVNPTPIVGGTIKNTIFINGATTASNIVVGSSTSTTGSAIAGYCNNFTFQNNSSSNTNFGFFMILVAGAGNGSGTLITGNDFTTGVDITAISIQGVDGAIVTQNTISGLSNADNEIDNGIRIRTGTINTVVSNNTISNLGYAGVATTGNAYGIWVESGNAASNVTISGNTITGFSSSGAATTVGTTGIYVSAATAGVVIEKNIIQNMKNTNTNGFGASGIQLSSSSTAANIVVRNNMISDIAGYGKASAGVADNGYGIVISAGAGYAIHHNSIHLNSDQTFAGGLPAAIHVTAGVSAAGAIDLRNNILVNSQALGTERYAIYSGAANTVFSSIDFNDYYTAGPNLGFIGSNRANLAAIQAGFGGNANSLNILPIFVAAGDLHLSANANSSLDNTGTPIATVTTDIDGQSRSATAPDMGADEFTFIGTCPGVNLSYVSNLSGATYQWQVDNGTGYVNITDGAVYGGTATNTLTLTAPPTAYNRYKYRCVVDGTNFSNISTYKVGVTWIGAVNTVWTVAGNWSCGVVPDQYTDVCINSGVPNYPVVGVNVTLRSLTVNPGASVTVGTGFAVTLTGF